MSQFSATRRRIPGTEFRGQFTYLQLGELSPDTNRPGRALVVSYYRHSPSLADFIADRDWLRAIVRGMLMPIVYTIKYPGLAALSIFFLIAAALVRRRYRRLAASA